MDVFGLHRTMHCDCDILCTKGYRLEEYHHIVKKFVERLKLKQIPYPWYLRLLPLTDLVKLYMLKSVIPVAVPGPEFSQRIYQEKNCWHLQA